MTRSRILIAASLLSIVALPAPAQSTSAGTVVIRTATLIDGLGAVRRNMDVVVRDGRIEAVRAAPDAPTSTSAAECWRRD